MKRLFTAIAVMMLMSLSLSAQKEKTGRHHKAKHHNKEAFKDANLTDAQKQQLKAINEDHRNKMQELQKNENISVKEMRSRRDAINKEHKAAIDNLLTAEQKNKLKEGKGKSKGKREHKKGDIGKMKTKLNLSDDQSAKIKALNEDYKNKMKNLKNESGDKAKNKEQFIALRKQHTEELKAILTQEQFAKMQAMHKQRGEGKHKERRMKTK